MEYKSSIERTKDSDVVYYNATIINNTTDDQSGINQIGTYDPPIRFNDTRETPIISNASKYQFSIVRFSMNGCGLDLPLFIPVIQTDQPNPNLTEYSVSLAYSQQFQYNGGFSQTVVITPPETPILWIPEVNNNDLAPTPASPVITQDFTSKYYWCSSYEHFLVCVNNALYRAHLAIRPQIVAQLITLFGGAVPIPPEYATEAGWLAYLQPPQMYWDKTNTKFYMTLDTKAFGIGYGPIPPLPTASAGPNTLSAATQPGEFLFFNTNMNNLFANFPTVYYNSTNGVFFKTPSYAPPFTNTFVLIPAPLPNGYSYLIDTDITSIISQSLGLGQATPPSPWTFGASSVSPTTEILGISANASRDPNIERLYKILYQETKSTSQFWSPISAITFVSTLLPIRKEETGQPIVLGSGNLGYSSSTSRSAFQPIITDITIDTAQYGSEGFREFILYNPQAEYRMASFENSDQEIKNVDISVFWKNRLDGNLYPVYMPNLASVEVKCMFRKVRE
jgi:hypothetical protein